jgi:hypothetical protein
MEPVSGKEHSTTFSAENKGGVWIFKEENTLEKRKIKVKSIRMSFLGSTGYGNFGR